VRFLYSRFAPVVRRFVGGLLGDRDAAEDVTQNTFLKLLTRLDRYVPGEAPFEAWLLRVARNAAHDELRRRRASMATQLTDCDGAVEPEGMFRTGILVDAIATLPQAQRQALVLRHVIGLSPHEIAHRLERSERAVNNLTHRARETLRDSLAALRDVPAASDSDRASHEGPTWMPPAPLPGSGRHGRPSGRRVVPIAG
jgi:RNA polymerase sigma-70 factor (ECF subfamily)